jgi:hypothetical protein
MQWDIKHNCFVYCSATYITKPTLFQISHQKQVGNRQKACLCVSRFGLWHSMKISLGYSVCKFVVNTKQKRFPYTVHSKLNTEIGQIKFILVFPKLRNWHEQAKANKSKIYSKQRTLFLWACYKMDICESKKTGSHAWHNSHVSFYTVDAFLKNV